MNVRYRVELSQAERYELTTMLSKGKRAARKLKRAQILLAADAGRSDDEIARTVAVSGSTVYRTKRRFVEGNLERALSEEHVLGGAQAHRQGGSPARGNRLREPSGRPRPLDPELLADAMVTLTDHESLSGETVRRRLAENGLKPWLKDMWCIPQVDGEYVARLEDVLDLYAEASDPKRPVVCFDESPIQLIRAFVNRSRPSRASSNASITSIAATAPSISSSVLDDGRSFFQILVAGAPSECATGPDRNDQNNDDQQKQPQHAADNQVPGGIVGVEPVRDP